MENMDMYMLNPCNNKIWWADWTVLTSSKTILYDNCFMLLLLFSEDDLESDLCYSSCSCKWVFMSRNRDGWFQEEVCALHRLLIAVFVQVHRGALWAHSGQAAGHRQLWDLLLKPQRLPGLHQWQVSTITDCLFIDGFILLFFINFIFFLKCFVMPFL